jgi:hypothetical protein
MQRLASSPRRTGRSFQVRARGSERRRRRCRSRAPRRCGS